MPRQSVQNIAELRDKLAAREGKPGFATNAEEIKAVIVEMGPVEPVTPDVQGTVPCALCPFVPDEVL